MAVSQGNAHKWTFGDVAQPQTPAPPPTSHLEAREGPAPAQWQAVKEEIRILYEKKPLKDVRKILEQRRGFRATERMYKARLSQWGFSKNYSDRDYQICAVLHHIRLKNDRPATAFVIHGHKRSLKDLHKYIKGRKMSENDFLATALNNVHCRSQADQEQEQQYAHVRAYTPEPEVDLDAPTNGPLTTLGEIVAAQSAKPSPAAAEPFPPGNPVSASGSCSTSAPRDSPTSQRLSPHDNLSPAFWSPLEAQLTPSTQQNSATQSPPPRENVSITWPRSAPSRPNASPTTASSSAKLSYAHSFTNPPPELLDDQVRYAGFVHNNSSPTMPCQHLGRNVEYMALQMIDAPSLRSLCGHDDIYTWRLMCDTSSPESSDFEQNCPTCNEHTNDHFISLPNLELPQQSRSILNETADVAPTAIQVPGSSRGHEHSWKWVARCFSACIYLNRGNDTLSRKSLADADAEFEKMLVPHQDPKVLLALNQTLQILHMHDEGEITKRIMRSAYDVALRVLGQDDPLTVIVRWMVLVADLQMKSGKISSGILLMAHEQFVQRHGYNDPRSIASLYCYGYMLNVERKLDQAERVLREVYSVSSNILGRKHLQSISALTNLHRCVSRRGRNEEAIALLHQAITDSRETLGANHPRRLESMRLLALLYQTQGRVDLTEDLYWQVLEGRIRMLGKSHSYTQGMKVDMETLLKKLGKWGGQVPSSDEIGIDTDHHTIKGKGKSLRQPVDSKKATLPETPEQLRLQDLFDWDPHEKWESPRSRSRGWSNPQTTQPLLDLDAFSALDPTRQQDISSGWDPMDADTRSLGGSDDTGSLHEAF